MTNFEKYKDEILPLAKNNRGFAFRMNKITACKLTGCENCIFTGSCIANRIKWLYEEYQEPAPKLTAEEYAFCKIATNGYIARNERGSLYIYSEKPVQNISGWRALNWKELNRDYFQFITWESGKAWSINDLLKLEVEG